MSVTYITLNLLLQNELLKGKKMESDSNDKGSKSLLLLHAQMAWYLTVMFDMKENRLVGSKLDQFFVMIG